ncbi:MAG: hypothetical protein MZU95_03980 [Desulfomicrobium escambiense]|nr:hypothetical protein [Desulfomicrobium escambiense]
MLEKEAAADANEQLAYYEDLIQELQIKIRQKQSAKELIIDKLKQEFKNTLQYSISCDDAYNNLKEKQAKNNGAKSIMRENLFFYIIAGD